MLCWVPMGASGCRGALAHGPYRTELIPIQASIAHQNQARGFIHAGEPQNSGGARRRREGAEGGCATQDHEAAWRMQPRQGSEARQDPATTFPKPPRCQNSAPEFRVTAELRPRPAAQALCRGGGRRLTVGWDKSIRQPSLAVSSQVRGGGQLRSEVFPFLLGSPSSIRDLGALGRCRGEEWEIFAWRQGAGSRSQSRSGRLRREGWRCPSTGLDSPRAGHGLRSTTSLPGIAPALPVGGGEPGAGQGGGSKHVGSVSAIQPLA